MADLGLGTVLAQILAGGGSLYNVFGGGGNTDMGVARDAAKLADPFAGERAGYMTQLRDLLTNPNSFKADPGYQFALGQGQDAIKGAGNAIYGGTRAGAIYPELAKFTEGYAAQNYDNRINQLLTASGATSGSPGTAGALYARGGEHRNESLGSGLNSILSGLFGGPGNGGNGILGNLLQRIFGGGGGGSIDPNGINMGTGSITPDGFNMGTGSITNDGYNMGTGDFVPSIGGFPDDFNPNDLSDPYGFDGINWDEMFGGDGGDFDFSNFLNGLDLG